MNAENEKYRNLLKNATTRNNENLPAEVNAIRSAYGVPLKTNQQKVQQKEIQPTSSDKSPPLIKAPPPSTQEQPKPTRNPLDVIRQINEDRQKRGIIDPQAQGGPKRGQANNPINNPPHPAFPLIQPRQDV